MVFEKQASKISTVINKEGFSLLELLTYVIESESKHVGNISWNIVIHQYTDDFLGKY